MGLMAESVDVGNNLEKFPGGNQRECTQHSDCGTDECCTFEAKATLDGSTEIFWSCKPLGHLNDICHSLASVHCPCQPGLRCKPKAVWFFGAGLCAPL
ncbi:uncharacterized protein LOC129233189 [Uloborus diversus]|uniref:uncharacterized protein LOC129233189 n=1 Tax=Uloborus diversus TaxID=327109 RepID=UPI00240A3BDE|nr:uncharacterized protein LOC129233189 [Uloborus diversus]